MQNQIPKFHLWYLREEREKRVGGQQPWEAAEKRNRRLRNLMRKNKMEAVETCKNIVSLSVFQRVLVGASLVAQWLRICLLMQGTRV